MIEILKQALDALETEVSIDWTNNDEFNASAEKMHDAIASLRQAIARLESQEPKCVVIVEVFGNDWRLEYMSLPVGKHKLYAQQYLYTHPPQRTWVGLTDDEIIDVIHPLVMADMPDEATDYEIAQAIEAKLKQKNGYVAQETNS